jgi:hypothetical protein
MARKQPVEALKVFNRNLDGQMIVGNPRSRSFDTRYPVVSPEAAETLVGAGLAKPIDFADYQRRQSAFEDGELDDQDEGERRPAAAPRRQATDVRRDRVTGGDAQGGTEPKITMSKAALREIAGKRSIDLDAFDAAKNNAERVALINAGGHPRGDDKDGRIAGSTADTTNHPANSTPHADGIGAQEDAAPTGGGGA